MPPLDPEKILAALNPEQARAAATIEGPVLVLAGAGTGKTRVITYRIAYMIARGIPPDAILGMTFTNKAAGEMRERLAGLCGADVASKVTLGTFHSFCARFLRREIGALGYLPGFTIADDADRNALLKQAAAQIGYAKEDAPVADASAFISRCKNALLFPQEALREAAPGEEPLAEIYGGYQKLLEIQNMLDFDDLLLFTHEILRGHPEILEKCRARWRYLLVDEYQDTNKVQFELVKMLAGDAENLCVVGDDDQSIYSWRGADAGNILHFTDHFPRARQQEIVLEQNYRSTNNILKAANAVLAGGCVRKEKNLWSQYGDGELITIAANESAEAEAEFIAADVRRLLDEHREWKYSDVAILYRSNYLSRQLEQTFRNFNVPYRVVGGQEFFERREVKDAAAYLRLLLNPREDQSLLRVLTAPPRGLGEKAVGKLKELRKTAHLPMTQALNHPDFLAAVTGKAGGAARELASVFARYRERFQEPGELALKAREYLRDVGYLGSFQKMYKDLDDAEKRRENVDEFLNAIAAFEAKSEGPQTLADCLERFSLLEENDRTEDKSDDGDGVILSTVHAAKGLEFPVVYLVAMERGIFPHERAVAEGSEDEELRLFYVAVTRARTRLTLTLARSRFRYGRTERQMPSPFLAKLPEELVRKGEGEDFLPKLSLNEINANFAKIFELLK